MGVYSVKTPRGSSLAVSSSATKYFCRMKPAAAQPEVPLIGFDYTPKSIDTSDLKAELSLVRISSSGTWPATSAAWTTPRKHRNSDLGASGTYDAGIATSDPTITANVGDVLTWWINPTVPFVYRFAPNELPKLQAGEEWCFVITAPASDALDFHFAAHLENA